MSQYHLDQDNRFLDYFISSLIFSIMLSPLFLIIALLIFYG